MICPMCGKTIEGTPSDILPGRDLCECCAENIRSFVKGKTHAEQKAALEYIEKCKETTQDSDVLKAIHSLLREHGAQAEIPSSATSSSSGNSTPRQSLLFQNVGSKIMSVSSFFCWFGIILSIILGIVLLGIGASSRNGGMLIFIGILVAIIGSVLSWLGSLITYGFGELVNNSKIQTELALQNAKKK